MKQTFAALLAALSMLGSVTADVIQLSWDNPTEFTDGSPIPATIVIVIDVYASFDLAAGTWDRVATVTNATTTTVDQPQSSYYRYYAVARTEGLVQEAAPGEWVVVSSDPSAPSNQIGVRMAALAPARITGIRRAAP